MTRSGHKTAIYHSGAFWSAWTSFLYFIFQDVASIPGARSKITPNTSAAQPLQPPKVPSIKVTKTADSSNRQDRIDQDRHHSHSKTGADRYTTKSDSKSSSLYKSNSNHLEIKGSIWDFHIQPIHSLPNLYSCSKITTTWIQISCQNWKGFFSNACHQIMI